MVICYKNSVIKFRGYLSPDFVEYEDRSGNQVYEFTAIDGLKGLDSIRSKPLVFPAGTAGVRGLAYNAIIGSLNQSFPTQRKVNISCDIYENRMSNLKSVSNNFSLRRRPFTQMAKV